MEATIEITTVIRFGLITAGLFVLIYVVCLLTPWLAKHVDKWMADYRAHHDPKKDPTYGIRSIYELPPKKEEKTDPEDSGEES